MYGLSINTIDKIVIVTNAIVAMQAVTSGIMCIYGYKWSKGLIGIMASYFGGAIGLVISYYLIESGEQVDSLLAIPICAAIFMVMAYNIPWVNHFSAGAIIGTKVSHMIGFALMQEGIIDYDIEALLVVPLIFGLIVGLITSGIFKNYVVILCMAFIGAINVVPDIVELMNGSLFAITGDIGYIFDPIDFILSFFGIETISGIEVVGIIIVFVISFFVQKKLSNKNSDNTIFMDK